MDIRLENLNKTIINCKKCPRLVKFIQKISTKNTNPGIAMVKLRISWIFDDFAFFDGF